MGFEASGSREVEIGGIGLRFMDKGFRAWGLRPQALEKWGLEA